MKNVLIRLLMWCWGFLVGYFAKHPSDSSFNAQQILLICNSTHNLAYSAGYTDARMSANPSAAEMKRMRQLQWQKDSIDIVEILLK